MKMTRDQKHQLNRAVHALTEVLRGQLSREAREAAEHCVFDESWRPAWWPIDESPAVGDAGGVDG